MFPSTLSTFNRPTTTDRLNSPSHSALHNTVSSAVGQIEAVIGTDASTLGTLIGDLRSASSGGGGHIQAANKGGTGQTAYTKGDLLVATSSSVLAKLAVSSTAGEVLAADPNQASGMKWAGVLASKVFISTTSSSIQSTNAEHILFAASVAGSVIGTNNAIRFKGAISKYSSNQNTFTVRAKYGVNTLISFVVPLGTGYLDSGAGFIEGMIVGTGTDTSQKGSVELFAVLPGHEMSSVVGISKALGAGYGTSSVVASAYQDLIVTGQWSGNAGSVVGQFFVVDKIG